MFTGVPVSASSEPACAPNASGSSSCDGERPSRTAVTATTGSSAATAPLTLISAVTHGDEQQHQHDQPRPALADPRDELLPGPRRHAGRVERLADDEQRRDEDHRRVAEARERLVEVEHVGRPQRQRRADRDELDREAPPDEQHDHAREDEVADRRRRS